MRDGGVNNMKNYKIAVAGTGYVGLSIATLLSQHHHETAVDIIPEKVEMIHNRKSPIQDDYIEKYLAEKELNLTVIGTDMLVYGDAYLNYAQRYNTLSSFMNFNYLGGEPLFKILSYISAHYFGQFGYYFALEFACILPVYATFVRRGWEKYSWLGMLIYYLCFYSFSLNLLRQSIAMSIIFWGYNYIVERKPIKFCVSVVIAAGFHLTAAIMLLLYPIHRIVTYVQDKDSKNIFSRIIGPYRKLIYALIILLCVAVLFLYSSLLPIIIALTGRFEGQLEFLSGGISMYWPYWLIMSLPIFLLFRRYNVRRSMDEEYSFLYLMFALSIILFQVIGINSESYRISLYFMQFLILLMVKSGCTEYQTFRIILERWCILIFLGAYYVYFFIIALFNHVYPYTSSMLGI